MTALYIILGIIAFIILLLSIKVMITVHYDEELTVSLSWLFLKFDLLPMKEKHPKKEKKKKEKKPKKTDEKIPEPKKKKDNMFVRFYHNQGVSGVVQLLKDAAAALGGMFRAFLFEELYVSLTVGSDDAADTAVKYGKVCAAAFPSMGFIVSNMRVKKYNIEVTPDFVGGSNSARMHVKAAVIPLRLINAVIVVAFQLLFKVVFKLLKHGKAKTADVEKQKKSNNT